MEAARGVCENGGGKIGSLTDVAGTRCRPWPCELDGSLPGEFALSSFVPVQRLLI